MDPSTIISLVVPVRTLSEANVRGCEHWSTRHRRAKNQKQITLLLLQAKIDKKPSIPFTCRLTRLSARKLDTDNLASSMKSIRDAISHWIGIDDRSEEIRWTYEQEKSKNYAVKIEIIQ